MNARQGAGAVAAGLGLAALVVALDQTAKRALLAHFAGTGRNVEAVTGFFNLVLTFNHGVTFGLFNGRSESSIATAVFSAVALAIVAALTVWLARAGSLRIVAAIGLVIGGAIGNLLDRLRLGGVVDFLDFHWQGHHYWAFNLADSAICTGVALLAWDSLLAGRR